MIAAVEQLAAALADRYVIQSELGRGASATVYLAQDLRHDRRVALKVLHSALGAALGVERFLREIRTAARLQHPHILPLFDSGTAAGQLFYTMPHVEAGSLRDRLKAEGPLPVAAVTQLALEVSSALTYAHALGVIHRDIKPENILLAGTGHYLLADFGIAYALDSGASGEGSGAGSRLTETGITLGTPAYMSPEQSAGDEPVDARADLYSLATVIFEALGGRPPFIGPNARSIIAQRLVELPPSLRQIRPDVPVEIDRALVRALARHATDRFESVTEFADVLATAPVAVEVPVPLQPAGGRRRFALKAGIGLLIVAGGGVGLRHLLSRDESKAPLDATAPRVVVVLPFKNLGSPSDQYFADGLTEEITSRLAGLSGLRVISRTSADQYRGSGKSLKEIGAELGAGYALEGSVRWERSPTGTGRIRVTPQLIRVADENSLWAADPYEADLTEVFRIQSEIAERVTTALDVALRAPERAALATVGTRNAEAYDFYLRGNDYLGRSNQAADLVNAANLYQRAVDADSGFGVAYAKLARCHTQIYWHYYDRTEARLELARKALASAGRLAPDLPETHMARGYYQYWAELDYDGAMREFGAALRGQPSNSELLQAMGYVERRRGRWEESLARFVEALRYDPRSGIRSFDVGDNYYSLRMYPEAEHYLDRAMTLSPDWPNPYVYRAWMYVTWSGDLARGRAVVGQALNRIEAGRLAPALQTGDRMSAALVTADSAFWPMLDGLSLTTFAGDTIRYHLLKAEADGFRGVPAAERAHGDSARALLQRRLASRPDDAKLLAALGLAYAHMGRYGDAVRAAERSAELLPLSQDAVSGPFILAYLARVYIAAGAQDKAIDILERLLTIPSWVSPAELRADPTWAALRSNPRFQRLATPG